MLVLNGDRAGMPAAERAAVGWLRARPGAGIAVSGCHLGREADLVVFTPSGVGVVEVKRLLRGTPPDPVLHTPSNARWSVPGFDGDPVHVHAGDTNPFDQANGAMFGLKRYLGPDVHVSSAVLIAPLADPLRIQHTGPPPPHGCALLNGTTAEDLTGWVDSLGRRGRVQVWTAERVGLALESLGAPAVTFADLAAAGFPSDGQTAPALPAPAAPAPAAAPGRPRRPRVSLRGPRPQRPPRRRQTRRHSGGRGQQSGLLPAALLFGVLSVGMLVFFAVVIADEFGESLPSRTTTTPAPGGRYSPAPLPPPPPAPEAPPCSYPFQPGC